MSLLASFHALDLHLLYLINQTWSSPIIDPLMARVSDWDSWRIPVVMAVILALIFGGFRARQFLILMAACLIIGDGMIDWGFKLAIHRPRPNETEPHLQVQSYLRFRDLLEAAPDAIFEVEQDGTIILLNLA